MGAAASIPLVAATAATAGLSLPAAAIFGAGVAVGAGVAWAAPDVVNDALDSVHDSTAAVMDYVRIFSSAYEKVKKAEAFVGVVKPVRDEASAATDYLRRVAKSAFEKLKAAAAFVKEKVIKLVHHLLGRKEAAAAKSEVDRAATASQDAWLDVLSRALARLAGSGRLLGSVAVPAAVRAALRASEMMALLETVVAALGDNISIPEDARSCISVVVAAVGICLEAIAAAGPAAAADA